MFKKFWLDVILGTLFIFAIMLGIDNMSSFKVFDVFDPIGAAFADMEMTDVFFSKIQDSNQGGEENVVLVNIGRVSRFEIGMLLDSISQHDPAVIGMDGFFDFPKEEDSIGDVVLADALSRVENLVMASKLEILDPEDPSQDSLIFSWPLFMPENVNTALVNLETGAADQEDLKMCRNFAVSEKVNGIEEIAFGVKLASYLEPEKAKKFIERGHDLEAINYKGNIYWEFEEPSEEEPEGKWIPPRFASLDVYDVMEFTYDPALIEGKIIIFCFLGNNLESRDDLEDNFFTPRNETYTGRAFPDMFGGVIHANIASMILKEDFVDKLSDNQLIFVAILICFLNVTLFSWIYKKIPKWYDGVTKLIQLTEFFGLVFVMIYVLDSYSMKLELTISLFAVALVGDALEVYYGVVKNSLTRAGRKELFRVSKI